MNKEVVDALATLRKTLESGDAANDEKAGINATFVIAGEILTLFERAVIALETIASAPKA